MPRFSLLSAVLAATLATPSLAQTGAWTIPPAGQVGTITDPTRVYCIIADSRLEDSPDCTIFTSDGNGGLESEGGWLRVNEDSNELEIYSWHCASIPESSTELLAYFTETDSEPVYGPTWNHIPGTNYVGVWTGDLSQEAPVVLSFVPESS
ncbi:hypothetical protein BJX70DRAFT_403567 [Aspergillus crustosus]